MKRNIAIVTGGDSLESASSIASARNVYENLDKEQFNRFLITVQNWKWRLIQVDGISSGQLETAAFDLKDFTLGDGSERTQFDAVFIAIHGAPAETGHLQAYFELVGIPYTGSGILASALAMDKQSCKHFLANAIGVSVPRHQFIRSGAQEFGENDIDFPCIVKPNAYGSGMGVALVANRSALAEAVRNIRGLGQDVLIEQFIQGREFTVGALIIEGKIEILPIAEVFREDPLRDLGLHGQYSFTDRQSARIQIAPELDANTAERLRRTAIEIGQALKCKSFYRVDFVTDENQDVYFLELNTIPGMTARSVFTKQILESNFEEGDVYNRIINQVIS